MSTATATTTEQTKSMTAKTFSKSSWITRSSFFQKIAKKAYEKCKDEDGKVTKKDVYAGVLYTHLKLAKHAGRAGCYPPSDEAINEMVQAADKDGSGHIDENEFTKILMATSVDSTSRMFVYFLLIMLLTPFLAHSMWQAMVAIDKDVIGSNFTDSAFINWIEEHAPFMKVIDKIVTIMIIPYIFDFIDSHATTIARSTPASKKEL